MPFERTIGPGRVHASDATLLSPQANQATTPRLGSMLPEKPKPKDPPSAWKRPIVMHEGRPVAPMHPPARAIERSLPSTRPPPPLSVPPQAEAKKPIPTWLAVVLGAASVFAVGGIVMLLAPSSSKSHPAPAAPPPSVAAWTLEDAPGVSVTPAPVLPSPAPTTTAQATTTSSSAPAKKPAPPPIQNVR